MRAARGLAYRPELDGLRAVAVLVVIVHHVWQPARFSGFVGVHIFFALSGYLITTLLLRERQQTGRLAFRLFYARRLLRLYPALLLMLVGSTAGYAWLSGSLPHHIKNGIFAATYTGNVYMAYGHAWIGPFGHTWSLALEEQYYLLWPVVLLVGLRLLRRPVTLAVALTAVAVASGAAYLHTFTFTGTDFAPQVTAFGLIAGSVLALLLAPGASDQARRLFAGPVAGVGGVAVLVGVLTVFSLTRAIPDGAYALFAVAATLLIIGSCTVNESSWLHGALSWRPAVAVGKISYGVYLWHYPVVQSIAHFLPNLSPWLVFPMALALTLLLATASYQFVELRFLRLKDRLRPSQEPQPAMASSTQPHTGRSPAPAPAPAEA